VNFRMRAMVVSFACHNLWLDWRAIAAPLARLFLDFEPGIHFPQLQMQAGVAGINTMRVYNVFKQAEDQDPTGAFIRKWVPELRAASLRALHSSPLGKATKKASGKKNKKKLQEGDDKKVGVKEFFTSPKARSSGAESSAAVHQVSQPSTTAVEESVDSYPNPIVLDMLSAARVAKERLAAVRSSEFGKEEACAVYQKHGSRKGKREALNLGEKTACKKSCSDAKKEEQENHGKVAAGSIVKQTTSVTTIFKPRAVLDPTHISSPAEKTTSGGVGIPLLSLKPQPEASESQDVQECFSSIHQKSHGAKISELTSSSSRFNTSEDNSSWACHACTFKNPKPEAPVCAICGTSRGPVFVAN